MSEPQEIRSEIVRDEPEQTTALARVQDTELSVEEIVARVRKVHDVQRQVMKEGTHYGKIPGVEKDCLLKPGAEILGMVFRLDPEFDAVQTYDGPHLSVVVKCTLYQVSTGQRLGSGMGSCSTRESKYAYRKGQRKCPKCNAEAIIKGKADYGGGWLCWNKKGGCGAKFKDGDKTIESQSADRVANEDLADVYNTVLKMAIKRAHVAAILFVTCASEIFTQDVEDAAEYDAEPAPVTPAKSAKPAQGVPVADGWLENLLGLLDCAESAEDLDACTNRARAAWQSLSDEERKQVTKAVEEAKKRLAAAA